MPNPQVPHDLESVLKELGVRHIPLRRVATGYVHPLPHTPVFHPVHRGVVLVGSWFTRIPVAELKDCLRGAGIALAYENESTVRGHRAYGVDARHIPLGNEVILTVDPRVYLLAARRCQALTAVRSY
ncbi:MAG TPA: hypothetical protein VJB87_04425 [Candidatus Nanoarchaeia archaeon]|nr:hypothetical protein [Candidatus Nanoarchaeia archaeon]